MQVSICDFEDSFTYNIFSELSQLGLKCEVIKFPHVKETLQKKINQKNKQAIILGPGPGHPREYTFLEDTVLHLIQNPNIMTMGICLGHQLLWFFQGQEVTRSRTPLHGQKEVYDLNKYWASRFTKQIQVQRYNSLAVKMSNSTKKTAQAQGWNVFVKNHECVMSARENVISYQFHPESVGTSCPQQFFEPLRSFLL